MTSSDDSFDGFDRRFRQRELNRSNGLETIPVVDLPQSHGNIPNTPLAASTISFLLGSTFALGLFTFLCGGFERYWWSTYQLGFFVAAWSAFHWGEFAVTAGWNREKCSVDCALLFFSRHSFSFHSIPLQHFCSTMAQCITSRTGSPSSNISSHFTSSLRSSLIHMFPFSVSCRALSDCFCSLIIACI